MSDKPRQPSSSSPAEPASALASDSPMKRYRPTRAEYRARSHDSAHGEDARALGPVIDHPLVPRGDAAMITDDAGLGELIAHLRAVGRFAYDSEFIGELTYIPKLCVIQVASAHRVALVDPLAGVDLMPFWELLADPSVEKIVHAGQQDLEPVYRHTQRCAANIFDVQIAAGFASLGYPLALSKLVKEITGVQLGKGLTFTHWDQRPLSAMQLRYAADDVRYLPAVRDELGRRLDALGHTDWVFEECGSLCNPDLYRFDPETQYRKVRGATSLQPAGLAVLRELTIWRDAAAKAHDVPPRAFLKDEILIDMARNPVKSVDKLARVKGLPRPIELTHGAEIVAAIARAAHTPAERLAGGKHREETPTDKFRADALWAAAECLSLGRGIDPNLIANRQEMVQLFHHLTAGGGDVDDLRLLQGWRKDAIAEPLRRLVRGESDIQLAWQNGTLKAQMSPRPA